MKIIQLYGGHECRVDDDKFDYLAKYKWHLNSCGYASRTTNYYIGSKRMTRSICMHREIIECPKGLVIDHIDGNKLDNTSSNLRVVTRSENCLSKTSKKGIPGVERRINRWIARIGHNYKRIYLGMFKTREEAIQARNKAAQRYHGKMARTYNA